MTTEAPEKFAIAIVGLPGAGKSTAARFMNEKIDGIFHETGDIVRLMAKNHFGDDFGEISSKELGEYSTMRRETDGGDYVAQDLLEMLEKDEKFPEKPVVICGMRDSEVPDLFSAEFDRFTVVWVHAPFKKRLERLQKRARQDESEFTKADLAERDGRESMWGTMDCAFGAHYFLENDECLRVLDARIDLALLRMGVTEW